MLNLYRVVTNGIHWPPESHSRRHEGRISQVSVAESGASVVEIRISARPALIPTVRAVASDLAGRADFDLDAISDLRMAVDEACTTLVGLSADHGMLGVDLVDSQPGRILAVLAHVGKLPGQRCGVADQDHGGIGGEAACAYRQENRGGQGRASGKRETKRAGRGGHERILRCRG